MKTSGIYKITCMANGRLYVGSAVSIENRWRVHRHGLTRGTHHNLHMQRTWDKYGAESFSFEILEVVRQKAELVAREQEWLDRLCLPEVSFNICARAGSTLGRQFSSQTREKQRVKKLGLLRSDEAKAKQSASMKGRRPGAAAIASVAAYNARRAAAAIEAKAFRKEKAAAERAEKRLNCACIRCGTRFHAKPSDAGKYCSQACYRNAPSSQATAADRGVALEREAVEA